MNKKCKGCGVMLQNSDVKKIGYVVDFNQDYCQRCYRLTHYGDITLSLKYGIDPDMVVHKLQQENGILAWVVDIMDFEEAFIPHFNEVFKDKTVILIITKSDLLSQLLTPEKCMTFIQQRCQSLHIHYDGIVVSGKYDDASAIEIKQQLKSYADGRTLIFAGKANAGKSTFINTLMGNTDLTTSRYPGTTIDFNPIKIDDDFTIIDTPGIEGSHSIVMEADEKDLKVICPTKPIRAKVYQLHSNQTYAIAGLVKIDILGVKKANMVVYVSNQLTIHRSKYDANDTLWKKHKGTTFKPTINTSEKITEYPKFKDKKDIVIAGLGWINVNGDYEKIIITTPHNVYLSVRKAMI